MIAQLSSDYVRTQPGIIKDRLLSYFLFEGRPLTTKGRWINPFVLAAWHASFRVPFAVPPAAPVFILGQGRSGTTLLGKVLGLHPDLCFLNEPKALWHAATGQDDLIGTYSDTPGRYVMDESDVTPNNTQRLQRAYCMVSTLTGRRRVLDKYPELLFRHAFVSAVFPQAKKIIMFRDPWQIAGSIAAWSAKHGDPQDDWWGRHGRKWRLLCDEVLRPDPALAGLAGRLHLITRAEDRAALEWIATVRAALRLQGNDAENTRLVLFEDMARNPVGVVSELLTFCGLGPAPTVLDYAGRAVSVPRSYHPPNIDPEIQAQIEPLWGQLTACVARVRTKE